MLEPDSLLAALGAGDVHLAHGRSEDQSILHGTTEDLLSALGAYVVRSGALGEPGVWRRAQDAGAGRAGMSSCRNLPLAMRELRGA